jgi:tRNA A37 threonylcarbamoyladenosine biosynthesis protein TsaE
MPKVGEYWYIGHTNAQGDVTYLCKILAVNSHIIVTSYTNSCYVYHIDTYNFNSLASAIKWKPTLFWRLLGYK